MKRIMLAASAVCLLAASGCGGSPTNTLDLMTVGDMAPPAADLAARPDMATGRMVKFVGKTFDVGLGDAMSGGLAGASVTVAELPSLIATSDGAGFFTLMLPPETPLTIATSLAGFAPTVRFAVILHASQPTSTFIGQPMLKRADFDQINSMGGVAAGSGIVGLVVVPTGSCTADGSGVTLAVTPSTGSIVYVASGLLPDTTATATGSTATTAFNAYLLGGSGAFHQQLMSTMECAAAPFPISPMPYFTVTGADEKVVAGALVLANVYLE